MMHQSPTGMDPSVDCSKATFGKGKRNQGFQLSFQQQFKFSRHAGSSHSYLSAACKGLFRHARFSAKGRAWGFLLYGHLNSSISTHIHVLVFSLLDHKQGCGSSRQLVATGMAPDEPRALSCILTHPPHGLCQPCLTLSRATN